MISFFLFSANNYKEEMCITAMKTLLDCCEKWKTKSNCCLGFIKPNASPT